MRKVEYVFFVRHRGEELLVESLPDVERTVFGHCEDAARSGRRRSAAGHPQSARDFAKSKTEDLCKRHDPEQPIGSLAAMQGLARKLSNAAPHSTACFYACWLVPNPVVAWGNGSVGCSCLRLARSSASANCRLIGAFANPHISLGWASPSPPSSRRNPLRA